MKIKEKNFTRKNVRKYSFDKFIAIAIVYKSDLL